MRNEVKLYLALALATLVISVGCQPEDSMQQQRNKQICYLVIENSGIGLNTGIYTAQEVFSAYPSIQDQWKETFGQVPERLGVGSIAESACSVPIDTITYDENKIIVSYATEGECEELISQLVLVEAAPLIDTVITRNTTR